MTFGKGHHKISKWKLGQPAKYSGSWIKRAMRGHERAAQKRTWKKDQER